MVLLLAAMDYLLSNPLEPVDVKKLEAACGVGVVITPDQIEAAVSKLSMTLKQPSV